MEVLLHPSPEAGLTGLFVASFLAATLLPGGSEALLFALLKLRPEQAIPALLLATAGNTLGGLSTYWLARLLPARELPMRLAWVRRWGSLSLALAWAPLIGDALCAAAGWLRVNWIAATLWMALGKFSRYAIVVWLSGI